MRVIFVFLFFVTTALSGMAQDIDNISLKRIQYIQGCGCSQENPIFVKVNFTSDYENPADLQIIVKYNNFSTYTSYVKDFDSSGNIFYSFCSKVGETNNFEVYFRAPNGAKSKRFEVSATAEDYNIK